YEMLPKLRFPADHEQMRGHAVPVIHRIARDGVLEIDDGGEFTVLADKKVSRGIIPVTEDKGRHLGQPLHTRYDPITHPAAETPVPPRDVEVGQFVVPTLDLQGKKLRPIPSGSLPCLSKFRQRAAAFKRTGIMNHA